MLSARSFALSGEKYPLSPILAHRRLDLLDRGCENAVSEHGGRKTTLCESYSLITNHARTGILKPDPDWQSLPDPVESAALSGLLSVEDGGSPLNLSCALASMAGGARLVSSVLKAKGHLASDSAHGARPNGSAGGRRLSRASPGLDPRKPGSSSARLSGTTSSTLQFYVSCAGTVCALVYPLIPVCLMMCGHGVTSLLLTTTLVLSSLVALGLSALLSRSHPTNYSNAEYLFKAKVRSASVMGRKDGLNDPETGVDGMADRRKSVQERFEREWNLLREEWKCAREAAAKEIDLDPAHKLPEGTVNLPQTEEDSPPAGGGSKARLKEIYSRELERIVREYEMGDPNKGTRATDRALLINRIFKVLSLGDSCALGNPALGITVSTQDK